MLVKVLEKAEVCGGRAVSRFRGVLGPRPCHTSVSHTSRWGRTTGDAQQALQDVHPGPGGGVTGRGGRRARARAW